MPKQPKLTEAFTAAVRQALAEGASFADAARQAGAAPHVAQGWLDRGRRELDAGGPERTPHMDFAEACDAAVQLLEAALVEQLRGLMYNARDERVRLEAIKFALARRYPDRWGRKREEAAETRQPPAASVYVYEMSPERRAELEVERDAALGAAPEAMGRA